MTLSSSQQHARAVAKLETCMQSAGIRMTDVAFTPSPHAFGYRNRIRLRIERNGRVRFFNERKTPTCVVLESVLRERLAFVLDLSARSPELFAAFSHLELRSDDDLGRPGVAFGGTANPPQIDGFLVGVRGDPDIALQRRTIVNGVWAFVPLDGFLQVNAAVNASLVTAVRDGARARGVTSVLDLFAGSGNFGLALAAAGLCVSAVETHEPSVRALAQAADAQGLALEAVAEPARIACQRLGAAHRSFDLVIIDAPRAGARETIHAVSGLNPRGVVLCSCNLETMARDAAELVAAGFALEELHLFDMFPHTSHAEALAWFRRRASHLG